MKINSRQYAKALFEAVDGKSQAEAKRMVMNFIRLVVGNRHEAKAQKIVKEFGRIWNRENKLIEAEITTAHRLDKKTKAAIEEYVLEVSGGEKIVVSEIEDKRLLGGTVIKYGDKVLDASLHTRLEDLRKMMVD